MVDLPENYDPKLDYTKDPPAPFDEAPPNKSPNGGMNIVDAGRKTQFGQPGGNIPRPDTAWSVRQAMKYLAAHDVDIMDMEAITKALGRKPTNGQLVAIRQLQKATREDASQRSAEFVTENIEGKLPQTTINADWENIKGMSDDELRQAIAAKLASINAPAGAAGRGGETRDNASAADSTKEA